jgi:hypothetical protein
MKRGRKPDTSAQHLAKGTFQPVRHAGQVDIMASGASIEPDALPVQPDWLTEAGAAVWLDDIGRVSSTRMATELDSDLFATYCNLQGAIASCWRSGEVPPATHLMEARKMQEIFGIAGAKSRVVKVGAAATANPFLRNGKR